jgi:hypothetical protein
MSQLLLNGVASPSHLLHRRRAMTLLLALPLLGTGLRPMHADTNITIDRRARSEDRVYALTFAAKPPGPDSTFGHTYIIWQREDDAKQMTVADSIGFHAIREGEANKIQLIFGEPGHLKNDNAEMPVAKLTVLVNSDAYQKALDRKLEWQRENSEYYGFWNNCVSHVAAIAQAVGLDTSAGTWVTPLDYVEDLAKRNFAPPTQRPQATAPVPAPPRPAVAPARPAPQPRRPNGPGIGDRGWGNGAGNGGSGGWGGGGGGGGGFGRWLGLRR